MSANPHNRTDVEDALHRLANHVECKICGLLPELLGEGRTIAVTDLAWQGSRFVTCLREIRDGKEGGGE